MTYEFNPQSPALELPNPYRVENTTLFASGAASLVCALLCLLAVRSHLAQSLAQHSADARVVFAVGLTLVLLLQGFYLIAVGASQMRFYFGRNRPQSLAPTLAALTTNDKGGSSPAADHYKECLRHSALGAAEPQGAINGVLYSWLPHLIFAPVLTQHQAQSQVRNFLGLSAVLLSYLLAWAAVSATTAVTWVGCVYAVVMLINFQLAGAATPAYGYSITPTTAMDGQDLSILVLLTVLGPVVFTFAAAKLPVWDDSAVNAVVLAVMLLLLASMGVFLMALRHQLADAPQEVGSARSAQTVTMNAHPGKLMEELDRLMMRDWVERIPNRRYSYSVPRIDAKQGMFTGELLEEMQPQPRMHGVAQSLRHALDEPFFKWLAVLSLLAAGCVVTSCIALWFTVLDILGGQPFGVALTLAASLAVTGRFTRAQAHQLWGRFDFVSQIVWVEMFGSFESAKVKIGNQITGQIQSDKDVINVEAMSLRVWVAEIESVAFGKDAPRQVVRMRALNQRAEQIAEEVKQFGEARSMVVAPTSVLDAQRLQKLGEINQLLGGNVQEQMALQAQRVANAFLPRTTSQASD